MLFGTPTINGSITSCGQLQLRDGRFHTGLEGRVCTAVSCVHSFLEQCLLGSARLNEAGPHSVGGWSVRCHIVFHSDVLRCNGRFDQQHRRTDV